MAMTAWSAKVLSSSSCRAGSNPVWERLTVMAPIGRPSRRIGTATRLRKVTIRASSPNEYSGSAATSGICWTAALRTARPAPLPRPGATGNSRFQASTPSAVTPS